MDEDNPCAECGGMCCSFRDMAISYLSMERGQRYDSMMIETDTSNLLLDDGTVPDMSWFIVRKPDGRRYLGFECHHRTADGLCGVYDERPEMCSAFECEVLEGEQELDEFKAEFARDGVPEDFEVREVTERVTEIIARDAEVPADV